MCVHFDSFLPTYSDISNNAITDLPVSMSRMTALTAMQFDIAPLAVFPTALCYMNFITSLFAPLKRFGYH